MTAGSAEGSAPATVRRFRVEKQGYSHGAWRVLHPDGSQVWRNQVFDHPHLGRIPISGPVCFQRKRDAVAWVLAHGQLVEAVR